MIKKFKHIMLITFLMLLMISTKTFAANFDKDGVFGEKYYNMLRYKRELLTVGKFAERMAHENEFKNSFINENYATFLGAGLSYWDGNEPIDWKNTICLVHEQSSTEENVYRIKTVVDVGFGEKNKENKLLITSYNKDDAPYSSDDELAAKISYAMYLLDTNGTDAEDTKYKQLVDYYIKEAVQKGIIKTDEIFGQMTNSNDVTSSYKPKFESKDVNYHSNYDSTIEEALQKYVQSVSNFVELKKLDHISNGKVVEPEERQTLDMDGETYVIVGPMRVKYTKAEQKDKENIEYGIGSIVINEGKKDAKIYNTQDGRDIVWVEQGDGTFSNQWMKIPSEKGFYLGIKKSVLPEGDYTISLHQKPITVYNGRMALMRGNYEQQLVTAASVGSGALERAGVVKYDIKHQEEKDLVIEKIDALNNSTKVRNVYLKVYAILSDGTKGWVNNKGKLAKEFSADKTTFITGEDGKISIPNLKDGKYYIYETKAGDGYLLEAQREKYKDEKDPNSFAGKSEYLNAVYLGEWDSTSKYQVLQIKQYKSAELTVRKVDSDNPNIKLDGVQFAIFVADSGWLGYNSQKNQVTFGNSWTNAFLFETGKSYCGLQKVQGEFTLKNLLYGNYYVIEVSTGANSEYKLENQKGYNATSNYQTVLTQSEWQMRSTSGKKIGSILHNSNTNVEVFNSDNTKYNFKRTNKAENTVSYIRLDWYNSQAENKSTQTIYYGTNHATFIIKNNKSEKEIGTLKIVKTDAKTKEKIVGAGFKLHVKTAEQEGWIYSSNGKADGEKTILSSKEEATEFIVENADGLEITGLPYGEYEIEETKFPTGYIVEENKKMSAKINGKKNSYIEVNIPNTPEPEKGTLQIIKIDEETKEKLIGAKFKIMIVRERNSEISDGVEDWLHSSNGTPSGEISFASENKATEFEITNKEGITIPGLPYGKYRIFETKAPEGYIAKEGYIEVVISENTKGHAKVEVPNIKEKTLTIEGTVWEDRPYLKATNDHILNSNVADKNLENEINNENAELNGDVYIKNITVKLRKKSDNSEIARTTTNEKGHYVFSRNKENKLLTEEQIKDYYIEFVYDNTKFITVIPNNGDNSSTNSKAKEETLTQDELDDNNLTGVDGKLPGSAITDKTIDLTTLIKDGKIKDINLGLIQKVDPKFSVLEDLAYVRVVLNGREYTYYPFGKTVDTDGNELEDQKLYSNNPYVPTVKQQTLTRYVGPIMPSVINAYNQAPASDIDVYAVYKISVRNDETTSVDSIYNEKKLNVESLTNRFDTNKYELDTTTISGQHSDEFAKWSLQENGTATYNLDNENSVFKNGIEKIKGDSTANNVVSTYIQFHMKDDERKKVMSGLSEAEDDIYPPTYTSATAYHDYLRKDNTWGEPEVKSYKGTSTNGYNDKKDEYTHRSVTKQADSYALYIHVQLGDGRTISGVVFEDKVITTNGEKLGDGKYDKSEENVVKGVKVELYNTDGTKAKVFDANGNEVNGETTTNQQGEYSFEGVTSGYYILKFTYGEGQGRLFDIKNDPVEDVKINDFKSTIINSAIKEKFDSAKNLPAGELPGAWYKEIGNNFSIALDDITIRNQFENNKYKSDGSINGVSFSGKLMTAETPSFAVTDEVENDMSVYSRFNFGIVKIPGTTIKTNKTMENVEITSQVGSTLLAQTPKVSTPTNTGALLLSDLDKINPRGSNELKLEAEQEPLFGADLVITYRIDLKNASDINYDSEEYYYYGTKNGAELTGVTVTEMVDKLTSDSKINNMNNGVLNITSNNGANVKIEKTTGTTGNPQTQSETTTYKITGFEELKVNQDDYITYSATAKVNSSEDDLLYENYERVEEVKLGRMTTLNSGFEFEDSSTRFTITPPTGEDRNPIYIITAFTSLIVIATGIIFVKKKVLDN